MDFKTKIINALFKCNVVNTTETDLEVQHIPNHIVEKFKERYGCDSLEDFGFIERPSIHLNHKIIDVVSTRVEYMRTNEEHAQIKYKVDAENLSIEVATTYVNSNLEKSFFIHLILEIIQSLYPWAHIYYIVDSNLLYQHNILATIGNFILKDVNRKKDSSNSNVEYNELKFLYEPNLCITRLGNPDFK